MYPGMNRLCLGFFAGLALCAGIAQAELDTADPEAVVERLHRALEAISDTALGERYQTLEAPVLETHDLDYMLQLILRGQWDGFSPEQQEQLLARFRALSVQDYANHFGDLDEGQFKITGQRQLGDQRAKVSAQLDTPKRQIEFIYTLNRNQKGWRIVSILADGVSELALRRSEYLRHYNAEGFEGLMHALDEQTRKSDS
mgnify:CR=1 FL=1